MAMQKLCRVLSLVAITAARADAQATQCASVLGRAAPSAVTLVVAPNDTANAAWVLQPDCSFEVIEIAPANNGVPMLNCSSRGIERVESIPARTELLHLEYNPVKELDLSDASRLYQLILAWCNLQSVDSFKFPSSVGIFDFDGNNLQGLAKGIISGKVNTMYLTRNKLASLDKFSLPTFLTVLHLDRNNFTSLNFSIPTGLVELHMDANKELAVIEKVAMPDSLTKFTCTECAVTVFHGVQLSKNLASVDIRGSTVTDFEIRESDVGILEKLDFTGDVAQTTCHNPTAELRRVKSAVPTCVITVPTSSTASSSSPSTTIIIIIGIITVVVCAVVGFLLYRKCVRGNSSHETTDDKYRDTTTVDAGHSSAARTPATRSSEYLANDIRNDEALIAFRIAYEDVQIIKVIGKGGFGIVHLGKFRGRKVAIKQILPNKAKDMRVVRSFMDEIRLCASLDHPRIVEFIGLRWSTLQDVAVINEYMAGGDLQVLLQKQQYCDPVHWFEASASLKAKSALALDVIVALVYLHSFNQPIIHRDLKTRNVLLSSDGDAKLSDFGTSRETLTDETMTGEIGTLAWIAPEVLRGDRYSEKADIYSLGVLLVELDTATHPYRTDITEKRASPISNTRIAMMVSAGKLKPSVSPRCPSDIAAAIALCLSFDPSDRPSAMAIHYELRRITRGRTSSKRRSPVIR